MHILYEGLSYLYYACSFKFLFLFYLFFFANLTLCVKIILQLYTFAVKKIHSKFSNKNLIQKIIDLISHRFIFHQKRTPNEITKKESIYPKGAADTKIGMGYDQKTN